MESNIKTKRNKHLFIVSFIIAIIMTTWVFPNIVHIISPQATMIMQKCNQLEQDNDKLSNQIDDTKDHISKIDDSTQQLEEDNKDLAKTISQMYITKDDLTAIKDIQEADQ